MPYVASNNLGYYSIVYALSLFILICVGELLIFEVSGVLCETFKMAAQ